MSINKELADKVDDTLKQSKMEFHNQPPRYYYSHRTTAIIAQQKGDRQT